MTTLNQLETIRLSGGPNAGVTVQTATSLNRLEFEIPHPNGRRLAVYERSGNTSTFRFTGYLGVGSGGSTIVSSHHLHNSDSPSAIA